VFHVVTPLRIMFSIERPLLAYLTNFVRQPEGLLQPVTRSRFSAPVQQTSWPRTGYQSELKVEIQANILPRGGPVCVASPVRRAS
jgi:hypothetical protein